MMTPHMELNASRGSTAVPGAVGGVLAAERNDWDYDFNGSLARNGSLEGSSEDVVFDRTDVRAVFIVLYTLVFCCCFFGNLLVIIVVTLSRRLRSITNFFLANLAVADLCVGMFCVYQNMFIYIVDSWVLGEALCKLYHFVHSLSYTASIFILVVICTERYFAIIHPITCKQILTPRRLRIVMLCVWVLSALYSSPRFFWVTTISMQHRRTGTSETICLMNRLKYNSHTFDLINFALLYAAPLVVMLVLYTRIALVLWDAGRGPPGIHQGHHPSHVRARKEERVTWRGVTPTLRVTFDAARESSNGAAVGGGDARVSIATEETAVPVVDGSPSPTWEPANGQARKSRRSRSSSGGAGGAAGRCYHVSASQNILKARRGVVRMLMVVVLTFAICNLPYHARKMWQYWSASYEGDSTFSTIFTSTTFLFTYFNSGINPLLYAFLSRNFRKGMRELMLCPSREKGRPLAPQSSITRKTSVRSNTKLYATTVAHPAAHLPANNLTLIANEHSG